jgi:hypothetical protein
MDPLLQISDCAEKYGFSILNDFGPKKKNLLFNVLVFPDSIESENFYYYFFRSHRNKA